MTTDSPLLRRWQFTGWALVGAAVLGGAAFVFAGLWLPLLAVAWLVPLALYDLRHKQIPHIAVVLLPWLAAGLLALWRGDWALAAIALVLELASERDALLTQPVGLRRTVFFAAALAAVVLLLWVQPQATPGALAVIGFWLLFELRWWTGADALTAITLALVWPDLRLVLALGAAHVVMLFALRGVPRLLVVPLKPLTDAELEQVAVPGLPAFALTALLLGLWLLAERLL